MKLRTSYFNSTVLKKDITRFAPLWGLYTVFMLMFVLLLWDSEGSGARFVTNAPYIMQFMGGLNLVYAGLCAVLLFGDLFKSQMCNALHAMPMRREGWFLTHLCAGLLFCIVPNALGALVAALLLQQYCYGAFLWLAVSVLQFLFYFAVGSFAVMCAGNRLGAAAVYGIINFFSLVAAWLVETFYDPILPGITLDVQRYAQISPVWQFSQAEYVGITYDNMTSTAQLHYFITEDWRYLFVAAAVGLLFAVLALLIYRRRALERAGDLIAVKPVAPVFLTVYTLCVGAVMYFVADLTSQSLRYVFLVIGFFIGFFTGRMLLEKKVNVFRWKSFLAFAVLLAVFGASLWLTWLDPAGITRYVPGADRVQQVQISPYSSRYYLENKSLCLTEPEDIQNITQLHSQLVKDHSTQGDMTLWLEYTLDSGTLIQRQYELPSSSPVGQALRQYYSSQECVFGTQTPQTLMKNAYLLEFHSYYEPLPNMVAATQTGLMNVDMDSMAEKYGGEGKVLQYILEDRFDEEPLITGLMEAVGKDCEAGTMAQLWNYHQDQEPCGYIFIEALEYEDEGAYTYKRTKNIEITVYEDCVNTIAYLKALTAQ